MEPGGKSAKRCCRRKAHTKTLTTKPSDAVKCSPTNLWHEDWPNLRGSCHMEQTRCCVNIALNGHIKRYKCGQLWNSNRRGWTRKAHQRKSHWTKALIRSATRSFHVKSPKFRQIEVAHELLKMQITKRWKIMGTPKSFFSMSWSMMEGLGDAIAWSDRCIVFDINIFCRFFLHLICHTLYNLVNCCIALHLACAH